MLDMELSVIRVGRELTFITTVRSSITSACDAELHFADKFRNGVRLFGQLPAAGAYAIDIDARKHCRFECPLSGPKLTSWEYIYNPYRG
jgi:hypothetical protein